jgi:glycosyltransferase involved in cell wall biosynthesis
MADISRQFARSRVTIAIPTLNRVKYLELALKSALAQTYSEVEVLVSNNASTDGTANYLASCTDSRLRVLNQPTLLSMVENWNACVGSATGEYFLLLSDDDLLEPDAIQELVAGYSETDDGQRVPGIVYGGGHIINSDEEVIRVFKQSPHREVARKLIPAFFRGERDLWLCAILFRTADILPGFSTEYSWAPDSVLWMRLVIQRGDAVFVAKELVRYRIHQNLTASLSLDSWKREIIQLSQFAIEVSNKKNALGPGFATEVNMAVTKLIAQSIPSRINQSLSSHKLQALRRYACELPAVLNPYGIKPLILGLLSLFLSKKTKTWLRKTFRRQSANVSQLQSF